MHSYDKIVILIILLASLTSAMATLSDSIIAEYDGTLRNGVAVDQSNTSKNLTYSNSSYRPELVLTNQTENGITYIPLNGSKTLFSANTSYGMKNYTLVYWLRLKNTVNLPKNWFVWSYDNTNYSGPTFQVSYLSSNDPTTFTAGTESNNWDIGIYPQIETNVTSANNSWVMLTVSLNETGAAWYLNSSRFNFLSDTVVGSFSNLPTSPLVIGNCFSCPASGSDSFDLDSLTVYNKTLNASEITELYQQGQEGQEFHLDPPPPLTISGVSTGNPETTTANITWNTNNNATSTLYYGTTVALGSTQSSLTNTTSHNLYLTNLSCNTIYHFKVSSTDTSTTVNSTLSNFETDPCSQVSSGGSSGLNNDAQTTENTSSEPSLIDTITSIPEISTSWWQRLIYFMAGPQRTLTITEEVVLDDGTTLSITQDQTSYATSESGYTQTTGLPHWTLIAGITIIVILVLVGWYYGLIPYLFTGQIAWATLAFIIFIAYIVWRWIKQ